MENDKNDLNNIEKLESADYYKLDYFRQKLDSNIKFQKWKTDMINLYGDNLELVKCYKDKILFCVDKKKNEKKYRYKCPICNNFICFYCLQAFSQDYEDCCLRGRIKTIPFEGPGFGESIFHQWIEFLLLIPFISFLYFIGCILNSLFFQLLKPVAYKEDDFEDSRVYMNYFEYKSAITFYLLYGIKVLFAIFITISFTPFVIIVDGSITIILILISIPFKFYPLKFVLGMLVAFYGDIIVV